METIIKNKKWHLWGLVAVRALQRIFGFTILTTRFLFTSPRDCIYHKEDNSWLVEFWEREQVSKVTLSCPVPAHPYSWTITKMLHFASFQPRPLSARICTEELKAFVSASPPGLNRGAAIQSGTCSCRWCLSKLCSVSESVAADTWHRESPAAAVTSRVLMYSTWHVCLLCLLEERPKGYWE